MTMGLESLESLISSNDPNDHEQVLEYLRGYATSDRSFAVTLGRALLLDGTSDLLRSHACWAVQGAGLLELVPDLVTLATTDDSWIVRADAVEVLGELGGEDAMSAVRKVSEDSESIVRGYAAVAAGVAGSPDDDPWLADWQAREEEDEARSEVMAARARLGNGEALRSFSDAFAKAQDPRVAGVMLVILDDLLDRRPPASLPACLTTFLDVLRAVNASERFSDRVMVENCIERLEAIRLRTTST